MDRNDGALTFRKAGPDDADTVIALICALAEYERLTPPDEDAQQRLRRDGFGTTPRFEVILSEWEGRVAGGALIFETYSTFLARPTLYLEDLFVLPEFRRQGIGRAMMAHLASLAETRGCGRMEWSVLEWNELGQSLYRAIGAEIKQDWRLCRWEPAQSGRVGETERR